MKKIYISVIGPNGSGKSTFIKGLTEELDSYKNICKVRFAKMATTRQPRNEAEKAIYKFVSDNEFVHMIVTNQLLEQREYTISENGEDKRVYYGLLADNDILYSHNEDDYEYEFTIFDSITPKTLLNIKEHANGVYNKMINIYILTSPGERLLRMTLRESNKSTEYEKNYEEVCTRFLDNVKQYGLIEKYITELSAPCRGKTRKDTINKDVKTDLQFNTSSEWYHIDNDTIDSFLDQQKCEEINVREFIKSIDHCFFGDNNKVFIMDDEIQSTNNEVSETPYQLQKIGRGFIRDIFLGNIKLP